MSYLFWLFEAQMSKIEPFFPLWRMVCPVLMIGR